MSSSATTYVKQVITKRYVVALTIIALLSTLALSMLHLLLKDAQDIAYVINVSGKQRMLSQRIALDVHKVYHYYHHNEKDFASAKIIQEELKRLGDEMLDANRVLSRGEFASEKKRELSWEMQELYFGKPQVAKRVEEYVATLKEFLSMQKAKEMERLVLFFNSESQRLLQDLDKVVMQYQKEGEADLRSLQRTENIIYGITLLSLLLEIIFIFQPMSRKLVELAMQRETFMGDLRYQVELRTIHLERANERLNNLASHDPLTGLLNRLTFEADILDLIKHYQKHRAPFAVILFDLDYFKDVNDTYGHDMGDFVLSEFAKLLMEHFRQGDKIYRAGGEEFVALLSRVSLQESLIIAQKIRHVVEMHAFENNHTLLHKTVSVGVYHTDIDSGIKSYKNIYKLVDTALYRAKEEGRNRVVLANENTHDANDIKEKEKCLFIFEERNLHALIDANGPIFEITGYHTESFIYKERDFLSLLYQEDLDLLEVNAPIYSRTVRIVCADEKVKIVRLNFLQHHGSVIVEMYDVKALASHVRDAMLLYNFNAMLEKSEDFIYFKDANHLFTGASKTLLSITSALSREELVGATDYEVFPKEYADAYFKLEKAIFNGDVDVAQEYQPFETKEGKKGWVDNRKYPIKDTDGNIIGLFGIARVLPDDFSIIKTASTPHTM